MASKKITMNQEDALERNRFNVSTFYLIEWVNQLMYLVFFVVLLTIFSLLMNFMTLLSLNAVLTEQQVGWLYAGTISSILVGVILIVAVQFKKGQFERTVRKELK